MKALVTAVIAAAVTAFAAGCSGTSAPPSHTHPATSVLTSLTRLQACQRLRADVTRNAGLPDLPALRYIADHVSAIPRLAMDARDAVKDITHTGIAPIPLALLKDDCAKARVHIPVP